MRGNTKKHNCLIDSILRALSSLGVARSLSRVETVRRTSIKPEIASGSRETRSAIMEITRRNLANQRVNISDKVEVAQESMAAFCIQPPRQLEVPEPSKACAVFLYM